MAFACAVGAHQYIQSRPELKIGLGKDSEILDVQAF